MRYLKSDAKIDRIVISWLQPTRVDATWLAAVADEVAVPAGPTPRTDRFCYITLDPTAGTRAIESWANVNASASRRMLVIDDRHRSEAARRIPALEHAWNPGETAPTRDAVVLEFRPVDPSKRGRRHHG